MFFLCVLEKKVVISLYSINVLAFRHIRKIVKVTIGFMSVRLSVRPQGAT